MNPGAVANEPSSGTGQPPAPIVRDPNPGPLRALLHAAYDLVWVLALVLLSPWWLLRWAFDPAFRSMARGRLGEPVDPAARAPVGDRPRVVVHGVSVGEVLGAAPLVAELRAKHPELEVVITTTTDTGLEVARKKYPDLVIERFPLDASFLVARFLRRVRPTLVVLIELEIWPNFLRNCNRAGIPVAVVNGRITQKSFGQYRVFRRILPQFNRISLFCVQLEEYAERFRELGGRSERVIVTGNMKADGLGTGEIDSDAIAEIARQLGPSEGQKVIVAGSTHSPEELLVCEAWQRGAPDARLVLVPRHPPRVPEVRRELAERGVEVQLLSRLRAGEAPDPRRPAIVDTIGELDSIYGLADVVFVGGSLIAHGGQNMLEPAARGRPVIHGPHVQNFRQEAALLERAGASIVVPDAARLAVELGALTSAPERCLARGAAGRQAVLEQRGATALTLEALERHCLAPILGAGGRA